MRVASGLEVLLGDLAMLRGRRVGLLVNPTAVDHEYRHAIDLLAAAGIKITALFGPEHGVRGDAQDMIAVDGEVDEATGAPVFSLYGHALESLSPTPSMLDLIDVMVFDIADIGSRYYTFVWTMVLAMRACAKANKAFVVLDRPNPLGGSREGGPIAPGFESFVGLVSVPNRHGLTAGEIARWRNAEENLGLDLQVVTLRGWQRSMLFAETNMRWVLPSPNMPTPDTALVYPGMCLVEGTELSEGRGTTRPFEWSGASHLSAQAVARILDGFLLPGCKFRPAVFRPTFHKHGSKPCGGVQIHVTNPREFLPYLTGVAFIKACRDADPNRFQWRSKAYEFVDKIPAIDLLAGNAIVRQAIDHGAPLAEISKSWSDCGDWFAEQVQSHLLYT